MRETLPLLYRDEFVVAVDKPSGLLVHRSLIDRHETRFALQIVRDQIGQRVYPVHRLDKGTSGVLLFALDPASARQLGASFDAGQVEKRYLAVVRGWIPSWIPETSIHIQEAHDLDTNQSALALRFSPKENWNPPPTGQVTGDRPGTSDR